MWTADQVEQVSCFYSVALARGQVSFYSLALARGQVSFYSVAIEKGYFFCLVAIVPFAELIKLSK